MSQKKVTRGSAIVVDRMFITDTGPEAMAPPGTSGENHCDDDSCSDDLNDYARPDYSDWAERNDAETSEDCESDFGAPDEQFHSDCPDCNPFVDEDEPGNGSFLGSCLGQPEPVSVYNLRATALLADVAMSFAERGVTASRGTIRCCAHYLATVANTGFTSATLESSNGESLTVPIDIACRWMVDAKVRKTSLEKVVTRKIAAQRSEAAARVVREIVEEAGRRLDGAGSAGSPVLDRNARTDLLQLADRLIKTRIRKL